MSIDTLNAIEIIQNQLYWICDQTPPKNQSNAYFFCIDNDLKYEPFCADFGPLDLGKTYCFVTELEKLLKDQNFLRYKIYHYTTIDPAKSSNSAYLMGAFQVIILGRTAEEAWLPFIDIRPPLADFRDASFAPCTYKCSILDCLRGLEYAIKLKWFDVRTFNLLEYQYYEKVENGDLNWIIPGKFIAFSGPSNMPRDARGWRTFTPEDYIPIFKKLGVGLVVRLNNKQYDALRFIQNGINHIDLYFLDGSCPSDDIVDAFLEAAEQENSAVAVHCKAGLGRTGTLIACYAMKHYKFPAADFIGWIRICRPGSVLGPQQQFLIDKQARFFAMCEYSPIWRSLSHTIKKKSSEVLLLRFQELTLSTEEKGAMSPEDKRIAKFGDFGQANRLLSKKKMQGTPRLDTSTITYSRSLTPNTPRIFKNSTTKQSYIPSGSGANSSSSQALSKIQTSRSPLISSTTNTTTAYGSSLKASSARQDSIPMPIPSYDTNALVSSQINYSIMIPGDNAQHLRTSDTMFKPSSVLTKPFSSLSPAKPLSASIMAYEGNLAFEQLSISEQTSNLERPAIYDRISTSKPISNFDRISGLDRTSTSTLDRVSAFDGISAYDHSNNEHDRNKSHNGPICRYNDDISPNKAKKTEVDKSFENVTTSASFCKYGDRYIDINHEQSDHKHTPDKYILKYKENQYHAKFRDSYHNKGNNTNPIYRSTDKGSSISPHQTKYTPVHSSVKHDYSTSATANYGNSNNKSYHYYGDEYSSSNNNIAYSYYRPSYVTTTATTATVTTNANSPLKMETKAYVDRTFIDLTPPKYGGVHRRY